MMKNKIQNLICFILITFFFACSVSSRPENNNLTVFQLDSDTIGVIQKIKNISNLSVVSKDQNDFKAEYKVGFVQGRLQAKGIITARDNQWGVLYITDPRTHLSRYASSKHSGSRRSCQYITRKLRRIH